MDDKVNNSDIVAKTETEVDLPSKQEQLFCELYVKHGCNATAAYMEWKPKAKQNSAMVAGWRMLRKDNIRAYIDKLQEDLKQSIRMSTEIMVQMRMQHIELMLQGTKKGYYDGVQKKTVEYIERDNRAINEEYAALERLLGLDKPKEVNVNVGPDQFHKDFLEAMKQVRVEGVDDAVPDNTEENTDNGSGA